MLTVNEMVLKQMADAAEKAECVLVFNPLSNNKAGGYFYGKSMTTCEMTTFVDFNPEAATVYVALYKGDVNPCNTGKNRPLVVLKAVGFQEVDKLNAFYRVLAKLLKPEPTSEERKPVELPNDLLEQVLAATKNGQTTVAVQ